MKENTQTSSGVVSHCSVSEADSRGGVSGGGGAIQRLSPSGDQQGPQRRPLPPSRAEMSSATVTRRPPTCCFCWCCSCTRKDGDPVKAELSNIKPAASEGPTIEEAMEWSQSFEKVMSNCTGREVFRQFLHSEYSDENMMFWVAVEELRELTDAQLVEEKARNIYEDYISILSPKEVSLDSRVRDEINHKMAVPTARMYDEAQLQIYTLMKRDSYPRFLNSKMYKRLTGQC